MAIRPILFSAPMVRALLDGRKTQTRRVLKPQPQILDELASEEQESLEIENRLFGEEGRWIVLAKPLPDEVGDLRWVREGWRCNGWATDVASIFYRASEGEGYTAMCEQYPVAGKKPLRVTGTWRPSIHMPRWASRLTIDVNAVRVERLQDISEEDAVAEGMFEFKGLGIWGFDPKGTPGNRVGASAVEAYAHLWDDLHHPGPACWNANPWVIVRTFDVIKANIDAVLATREPGG